MPATVESLWKEAEQYREEHRQRLRAEGKSRREAVALAWKEMAEEYVPLAVEAERKPKFETILGPDAECCRDILDPDYNETDFGKRIWDAYCWVMDEFGRIVHDHPGGTVVDYGLAKTPPPTGYACSLVDTYARLPPEKRIDLHFKLLHLARQKVRGIRR
jgi:hypothetical protein